MGCVEGNGMHKKPHHKHHGYKRHAKIQPRPFRAIFAQTLESIASAQMEAQKMLLPLIVGKPLSPVESAILIVMYADALLVGDPNAKDHTMDEHELSGAITLFLHLWKAGKFIPTPDYPYTLQQTQVEIDTED